MQLVSNVWSLQDVIAINVYGSSNVLVLSLTDTHNPWKHRHFSVLDQLRMHFQIHIEIARLLM